MLLSICIPTYNRVNELKELNDLFLRNVLNNYGESVEVIVSDNSDIAAAEQNKTNLDVRVKYSKNETNLGFAGNVVRCIELAGAEYIWLLPDNDEILWEGFELLIKLLKEKTCDCVLIPYIYKNDFGESCLQNYPFASSKVVYSLSDMFGLSNDFLPFVLLSSGVVRVKKNAIETTANSYKDNIFIQIPLLLSMLTESSNIIVLEKPLINYNVELKGRFAPIKLFESYTNLINTLSLIYKSIQSTSEIRIKDTYKNIILLLLSHYSGLRRVHGVDGSKLYFSLCLYKYTSVKNIFLCFIMLLPKRISGLCYLLLLCRDYANRNSSNNFYYWISKYKQAFSILQKNIKYM